MHTTGSRACRLGLLLLAMLAPGCDDEAPAGADASFEAGVPLDAPEPPSFGEDGGTSTLVLDFTATGCAPLDQEPLRCSGVAPLTLSFVPVSTTAVAQVLWDFGDQTAKSFELTPRHTYALPGSYDVTLVGGDATGAVSRTRSAFVVVRPNPLGSSCDVPEQCDPAQPMSCVCGAGAGCGASFPRGLCTTSCRDMPCTGSSVCADLTLGGASTPQQPWRALLCLAGCEDDRGCGPGLHCRTLPGRYPTGGWVKGCFAPEPGDVGAGCRLADGALHPEACLTGRCLDLGAYGVCSMDCRQATCPPGTVCAAFAGETACLRPCTPGHQCTEDPLLACEQPGWTGPKGFTATGLPAGGALCAPRRCTSDAACGASGRCQRVAGVGNCVARSN